MNLKKHDELLNNWRARYADATFISDGPVDTNQWLSVERRVLFLAKEAYGDLGSSQTWGLPHLIREWQGPKHKFWWTLGYWAYGIQRLTHGPIPPNPNYEEKWEEVRESVLASAVVNIKKARGCSSSKDDDLRQYVRNDGGLLRQQVEGLNPHVVVISEDSVRVSEHGYDELAADGLLARELVEGVANAEIIEDYPGYPKGPCVLLLQRTKDGRPVHAVWGLPAGHASPAVLITAYLPDPEKWEPGFKRRAQ